VTRLESGKLQLHAVTADLVPLVRRMADSFASFAAHREIAFRLSCPVAGVYATFDADQMEKILSNLVGNALKFTPSGGSVELVMRVDDSAQQVVLEVQDSGPGIATQHQPHVFDRFYQVDDSSSRAHDGVGIGLALTKELVELHGGSISLRSDPGEGCTFSARIPLALPLQMAPTPIDPAQLLPRATGATRAAATESHRTSPKPTTASESAPSFAPPAALAQAASHAQSHSRDELTVLVVEDNLELLEYLRDHLSARFRVLSAPNGIRGLEMAREHVPDLIVSDVMMPLMDGQAMCEAIKEDAEIDFIPVILLTARASRESRLAGLSGGADDYLTKPVDLAELMIRADNLIASRRRVRERFEALRQPLPAMDLPFRVAPRDATAEAMLRRFHAALAAHLSDPDFQVDGMASAMGMSRTTLYRNLREHLGCAPMDAFWEYRLAQAAQWLESTPITVSEVAYGVGFRSVPHFCTRFRERFGETPSGYRLRRSTVPE
jgi:DNA-binding response OmpR family regulator